MYFLDGFARDALGFLVTALGGLLTLVVLDRGWVRGLRFRAPATPAEPPLFGGADVFVILVLHLALLVVFGGLVELLTRVEAGESAPSTPMLVVSRVAVVAAAGIGACAFAFLTVRVRSGQPLSVLGLRASSPSNLLPVVLSFAAAYVPILWIAQISRVLLESALDASVGEQLAVELFREIASSGDAYAVALFATAPIVVAPIAEEILFRGVCFGWLRARFGFAVACVGSSALFAAWHMSLYGAVPLFFVGALLAWVYHRSGSLWNAIVWHAIFNSVSVVQMLVEASRADAA